MQEEHATGANQSKKRFDKKTADAKAYSVGDYVWVFQEVVPLKGIKELLKKWRGPFQITEVHQAGRFYRLKSDEQLITKISLSNKTI